MVTETPKTNIDNNSTSAISPETKNSPDGQELAKDTAKKHSELKKETKHSFESISENVENENLKKTISILGKHIDSKLDGFTDSAKSNIKLVLINDFSKKINNLGDFGLGEKITNMLDNILNIFSRDDNESKTEKITAIDTLFLELGISGLKEDIDYKLADITDDFNKKNLKQTFESINGIDIPEGNSNEKLEVIKTNLLITSEKFDKYTEKGKTIQKFASALGMGESLKEFIESLKENHPFIASILSMFLGFATEIGGKSSEASISSLKEFSKDTDDFPLDKLENGKIDSLDNEKLNTFYEYLDAKKIDYSRNEFWQEFLNGNNKSGDDIPDKIMELKELFERNFTNGYSLEYLNLDDFIKKLNSLPNFEKEEKQAKVDKINEEKEKQIAAKKEEIKNAPEEKKAKIQKEIKEIEKTKKVSFEELLKQDKIDINGDIKNISITNGGKNIKIGEKTYDISIKYFGERFNKIEGNNGKYTIYANAPDKVISKNLGELQIKGILQDLVVDDNVNTTIKAGEYEVDLIITEKA